MFNNLIESRSHSREFKRRGSFLLYTVAAYVLLFVGAGVGSIYAYEAHLDEQATGVSITMMAAAQPEIPKTVGVRAPVHGIRGANTNPGVPERKSPMAEISAAVVPAKVSAQRNTDLPAPHGQYKIGNRDLDAGLPGLDRGSSDVVPQANGNDIAKAVGAPPEAPVKKPAPPQIIKKSHVLNSYALELPKPEYPASASRIHVSGTVSVQVLIDEAGKVISAHVTSGHLLLAPAAVRAAYQARFSPTVVGDMKVKVSGIINYNFVLQ